MGQASTKSTLPNSQIAGSFPVIIKGCEKPSEQLFSCLEGLQKSKKEHTDAESRNTPVKSSSVSECSKLIEKYNDCYASKIGNRANAKYTKVQERVPEEYRYNPQKQ